MAVTESPRTVILELSLEYLENPFVESAEEARRILCNDLIIEGTTPPLALHDPSLKIEWSEREQFDPFSPTPQIQERLKA